jgi:DNA-binding protein HU-beta
MILSPVNMFSNIFFEIERKNDDFFYFIVCYLFSNSYICRVKMYVYCFKSKKKSEILMNKAELINAIAAESGLSKADAKKALDATVKAVSETLVAGDKVSLVGFGTFSVSERAARQGINPATKQTITIGAKKVAKFKPGAELNASIN